MNENWKEQIHNAVAVLLAKNNKAVAYFTRRDILQETAEPIHLVWEMPEVQNIIRKQNADGSWAGTGKKTPAYPENHTRLVATFKAFRTLVERYQFTRESAPIEKASEYLFSFQTLEGDIRGFIGNQYATYYTGYILSVLTKAGYADDPRVKNGMQWLLKMRQDDGGWTIPILTHHFDGRTMYRLTSSYAEPVEPVRSQPFSHNWTDMVLRAFAVHPVYRQSEEAKVAGNLLKSRFFQPDVYSSYKSASYWTRFVFWWPNLLTALESLSLLGFAAEDPDINKGLQWFFDNRKEDGLWDCSYNGREIKQSRSYYLERIWLSYRICRMLKLFLR
ncbi:hypothetical protein [Dehalococcoides mccartyi]|uniref:hypothetical protein n=1 Tax=Dehalococcoides mccartyi TaxID=61435 RepID=UPI002FCC2529